MKINIAVYTAVEGFDWQPGSAYGLSELEKYHGMIGQFPDILMDDIPYGGVFVCDGRVVFYRYHVFTKGDARGRDAFYCVLGTLPFEEMRKVDLGRILASHAFSRPQKPFPTELDVEECETLPAEPKTLEDLNHALKALHSAGEVGYYATFFPAGNFFCRMNGSREHPRLDLTYSNSCLKSGIPTVRQTASPPPHRPSQTTSRPFPQREIANVPPSERNSSQNLIIWILSAILCMVCAALVAVLVWMRQPNPPPVPERETWPMSLVEPQGGQEKAKTNEVKQIPEPSPIRVQNREEKPKVEKRDADVVAVPMGMDVVLPAYSNDLCECQACGGSGRRRQTVNQDGLSRADQEGHGCVECLGDGFLVCFPCRGRGCNACRGYGKWKCPHCGGTGETGMSRKSQDKALDECLTCKGYGRVTKILKRCPSCSGRKMIWDCPVCRRGGDHHEARAGKWVLCDSTGNLVSEGTCPACHGKKHRECKECRGRGYVEESPQDPIGAACRKTEGAKETAEVLK